MIWGRWPWTINHAVEAQMVKSLTDLVTDRQDKTRQDKTVAGDQSGLARLCGPAAVALP